MNPVQILKKLISFPTYTESYDNRIRKYLLDLLTKSQKDLKVIDIPNTKGRSFVVRKKGNNTKNPLAFLCHMDTVPPASKWKSNPLSADLKNGKVTGLGASDMKGSIASLLSALLQNKTVKSDLFLIFTSDEETTVSDINKVKKELKLKNATIISLEPTDKEIRIGQKGILETEIIMPGKNVHASALNKKNNKKLSAIYKISEVMDFVKKQEEALGKKDNLKYGKSTINFGQINGGNAVNVSPDFCSLKIGYRLVPCFNIDKIYQELEKKTKEIDQKSKIEIMLKGNSFYQTPDKEISKIKEIAGISQSRKLTISNTWSEIAMVKESNRCLIFGPGQEKQAHTANEFIAKKDLEKFTEIYSDILKFF